MSNGSSSANGSPGTCYGYAIRSSLPFHYLRSGEGEPIEISLETSTVPEPSEPPLLEWTPTPELPFDGRLHDVDDGYRLWVAAAGWFGIEPGAPRITVPFESDVVRREERIWGIPAALCFVGRGDLPLHAAAVEIDGKAVILGAPRTYGKTTLAAALAGAGYRLLSEDVTCIRPAERPAVIPGPAMLRLRHDVAERLEVPNTTLLGDEDDRVHLAVDPALRGDCRPVPLAGIMLLRRAEHDVRVERAETAEAIRDLWSLSFRLPTSADRTLCFAAIVGLARSVPTWNLHRPLRFDELAATVDRVVATV